jgi:hypothetical protein
MIQRERGRRVAKKAPAKAGAFLIVNANPTTDGLKSPLVYRYFFV